MSGRHRIRWPALALLAFAAIASPCRGAETPAAEQPTDAAKLVDGNTRFACDLYAELRDMKSLDGENIIVSPYSISIALGMTYAGSRGKTAKEMAEVLHFNLSQERLHPAFKQLADGLRPSGQDAGYELHTANALWPDRKTTLVPDYLDLTGRYYGTRPRPVDFGKPEEAAGIINTWVEEQTRDKIKDLLKTGDVADATLVLTNAVYFKGEWAAAFDKKHTREAPFIRPGKGSVQVDTMWQSGTFPFADVRRVRVAQFPYGKGDLAMLVMVPPRSTTMDRFEKDLTPETVARYVEAAISSFAPRAHALRIWNPHPPYSRTSSCPDCTPLLVSLHLHPAELRPGRPDADRGRSAVEPRFRLRADGRCAGIIDHHLQLGSRPELGAPGLGRRSNHRGG